MDEKKYLVPHNISHDYTVGPFKLLGLIEGLVLGFIVYNVAGLLPIKYASLAMVVKLALTFRHPLNIII